MTAPQKSLSRDAIAEMLDIFERNRAGEQAGIYSVCSAHPLVLEAAMRQALHDDSILVVEATANQVNQFGGYTGMVPDQFPDFVYRIAESAAYPRERIVLGGDHLGPLCWTGDGAEQAMKKACDLVAAYVSAGFRKIHLDTSMACAGDVEPLSNVTVASRAARLCRAAEQAASSAGIAARPVYVIGSEVPVPGGETGGLEELEVTNVERVEQTIEAHKAAFAEAGLEDVWQRVIALVVQPGVEFNHTDIHTYDATKARALSNAVLSFPGMVFEAHSTDYQPRSAYVELVGNHFAILKVGPQLTFAMREALFALAAIEKETMAVSDQSHLLDVCERVMLNEPEHWIQHYPNREPAGRMCRRYSYSDRIRYYWPHPEINNAVEQLMTNLEKTGMPLPLLSQHLPDSYEAVRAGSLTASPRELVIHHVMAVTDVYSEACRKND